MDVTNSSIFRTFVARNGASQAHALRALRCVPTGTSRALLRHAPFACYTVSGAGAWTTDLDGNRRLDLHNNYTAMLHGHAHPAITAAVSAQLTQGTAFSTPSVHEAALAELLSARIPTVERIVFNNSGTEAVMVALRVARAVTGRNRIGRFEGGYHGSSDFAMVGGHDLPTPADPTLLSVPTADTGGLPLAAVSDTVLIRYNSVDAVRAAVRTHGQELAAIIVEPMLGAGGVIPAETEFLRVLREETRRAGIVLICDEVITLRQAVGGAQAGYALDPDLTTMAKIIGGGFPIGAVGGKAAIMRCFDDPAAGGTVANLGTFSANAVSVAAGHAAMTLFDAAAVERLNALGDSTRAALRELFARHGAAAQVSGAGSLLQYHWTRVPLRDARAAATADDTLKLLTFLGLCNRGIQTSARGMCALSTPMTQDDIDTFIAAFDATLHDMADEGWPVRG